MCRYGMKMMVDMNDMNIELCKFTVIHHQLPKHKFDYLALLTRQQHYQDKLGKAWRIYGGFQKGG